MVQSWKGCVPKGTGGSNPPLSVIFRTLLMSPGAMQEVIIQPRQVRKKAAADSWFLCRSLPGLFKGVFFYFKRLATFFRLEWCRGILPTGVTVSPNIAPLGFYFLQYLLTVLSLFFTCQCVKHCRAFYSTPQCLWNSYSSLLRMTYPSTSFIFRQTYTRNSLGNRLP